MLHENEPRTPDGQGGTGATAADVEAAFRDRIKAQRCPACGAPFTDAAVDWGYAWREGYLDCLHDQEWMMRDGPFKVRCAACERRSWYGLFSGRAELAERRTY